MPCQAYVPPRLVMPHGGHSFVGRGLYACQLRPWLRIFPPEQLLVLTLEQLAPAAVQVTMAEVQRHVGLPTNPIADTAPKNFRGTSEPAPGGAGGQPEQQGAVDQLSEVCPGRLNAPGAAQRPLRRERVATAVLSPVQRRAGGVA